MVLRLVDVRMGAAGASPTGAPSSAALPSAPYQDQRHADGCGQQRHRCANPEEGPESDTGLRARRLEHDHVRDRTEEGQIPREGRGQGEQQP